MIGNAVILLWSFTITNPTLAPQTINLGTAPTNNNYVPTNIAIRGIQIPQATNLNISLGNSVDNNSNVFAFIVSQYFDNNHTGYLNLSGQGQEIVKAGENLYVTYSIPQQYDGNPITIDILGYATSSSD